jgi:hypothetical protein
LAVYIAVVSRIPTSHCRCHEKKPIEQPAKKKCPFGELRLLAQFALIAAAVELPPPLPVEAPATVAEPGSVQPPLIRHVDARAPPAERAFSKMV